MGRATAYPGWDRYLGVIDLWRVRPDGGAAIRGGENAEFRSVNCIAIATESSGAALHKIARGAMSDSEAIMGHHRTDWILVCLAGFISIGAPGLSSAEAAAS